MSEKRIREAARHFNEMCTDDRECIAKQGHDGPHRNMSREWENPHAKLRLHRKKSDK